MLNINSAVHDY